MRIENTHKTIFKNILTESGLDLQKFTFSGSTNTFNIKYIGDYFEFNIKMIEQEKYKCSLKSTNNTKTIIYQKQWADMLNLLKQWGDKIANDIEHSSLIIDNYEEDFPSIIKRYCKKFIEIYNQALTAEKAGLTEICGLGYRKSFEFLIKDYLIKKNEKDQHNKIKNLPIYQCINTFVTNDEIKLIASRVLWLGNDQARYIKLWKNKTLRDLKQLIKLTIEWIEHHEAILKLQETMPHKKNH